MIFSQPTEKIGVYWAASVFGVTRKAGNTQLAGIVTHEANRLLSQDSKSVSCEIILPQERTGKFYSEKGLDFSGIFHDCIHLSITVPVMVICLDGAMVDDGAAAELGARFGYRKALGLEDSGRLPIIGFRTDPRGGETEYGVNLMLSEACDVIVVDKSIHSDYHSLAAPLSREIVTRGLKAIS